MEWIFSSVSRSGAERVFACGESHGLSRSGYPPLQMSRIVAERISVARFFARGGLSQSVERTAQNRGVSPLCTLAIIREDDTVNRENDTDVREYIRKDTLYRWIKLTFLLAQPCCGAQRPAPTENTGAHHANVASLEKTNKNKNIE